MHIKAFLKDIWVEITTAIVVFILVYLFLAAYGTNISSKDMQTNIKEQFEVAIKDGQIQDYNDINLPPSYSSDYDELIKNNGKINNIIAVKLLNAAKKKYPNYFDLEKIYVEQKVNNLYSAALSSMLAFIIAALCHFYWWRYKVREIRKDLPEILYPPLLENLSDLLPVQFRIILDKFAESHEIIIKDIYHGYPYEYTDALTNPNNILHNSESKIFAENSSSGISLWLEDCAVPRYNGLAASLLSVARKSVYSTTYCSDKLLNGLVDPEDKEGIVAWLTAVNNRKKNSSDDTFNVYRTQIVDTGDLENFLNKVKQLGDPEVNRYLEIYANSDVCDKYKIYEIPKSNQHYFGEYIIFDEKVMLQYDQTFCVLQVFLGKIVSKHVGAFKYLPDNNYRINHVEKLKQKII